VISDENSVVSSLPNTHLSSGKRALARLLAGLRSGLVMKVSLLIATVGAGLALLFALLGAVLIRDYELQRQLGQINQLLTTVRSTVQIASFTADHSLAIEVAQGLMTNPSVAAVRIESDKELLADLKKKAAGSGTAHQVRQTVFSPFDSQLKVGEIVLIADSDFIQSQAARYAGFIAIALLLQVIAVTAVVVLVMLRSVVRPITTLSTELQGIEGHSNQHLSTPKGHEGNEIGLLAQAFNRMIDRMKALLDTELRMREKVAHSEMRFRELAENSPDIIARYDLNFKLVFANPAYSRETGIPLRYALAADADEQRTWRPTMPRTHFTSRLRGVINSGLSDSMLWEWKREGGQTVCHEMQVVAEHDTHGQAVGALVIGHNITERKRIEQQLLHQATHDTLTGLVNRACFKDRLQHAMFKAQRAGDQLTVIFIDLDNFKVVNDTLGHDMGDALLKHLASRMLIALRQSDTVARFGGDEFVVLLEHNASNTERDVVVQKLFDTLSMPCDINGQQLFPGASLGLAVYPTDGEDVDSLMRNADTAMYVAKAQGRNGYRFYSAEMNSEAQAWVALSNDLRLALEQQQFFLCYQPKVCLATGALQGMEALIRWQHPSRGLVSPAQFIPVAEKNGLIAAIGTWVLQETCRQIRAWHDLGLTPGRVAVNLSAAQFNGDLLPLQVQEILQTQALSGDCLEVEITEGVIMADAQSSIESLQRLREMGVQVALDDFGTGYSSLNYLTRLPVNKLKIDKSFIDGIETKASDMLIVRTIIAMAHALDLVVVAEGVESVGQRESLHAANCDQFQGYLFSRPLPAAEMQALLEAQTMPQDTLQSTSGCV
jgi:diguanylate cyclase (GGDEF)-like protein/PAS domain S-box-containing protein